MGLDDRALQRGRVCSGLRGARCCLQEQLDEAVFKLGHKYENLAHDLAGQVMEVVCQHDFGQHHVDLLQAQVGVDYQGGVVAARVGQALAAAASRPIVRATRAVGA